MSCSEGFVSAHMPQTSFVRSGSKLCQTLRGETRLVQNRHGTRCFVTPKSLWPHLVYVKKIYKQKANLLHISALIRLSSLSFAQNVLPWEQAFVFLLWHLLERLPARMSKAGQEVCER